MNLRLCLVFVATIAFAAMATCAPRAAETGAPVQAEDLFHIGLVDEARISPDGTQVAFVVTNLDGKSNRYLSNLWLVATDGASPARQITRGDSDRQPSWSPDGKTLAFVSRRSKHSVIYALPLALGGEARPLTAALGDASMPVWSHDGKHIAYSQVERDAVPATRVDWKAANVKPDPKFAKSDIRTISTMHFETNSVGYTYDRRSHLWVMNADGTGATALTSGAFSETGARWTPDDASIAFNSYRGLESRQQRGDIFVVAASGGVARKLELPHLRSQLTALSGDGTRAWFLSRDVQDSAGSEGLGSVRLDGSAPSQLIAQDQVMFGDRVLADMKEGGAGCGPLPGPHDAWLVADVSLPGTTALLKIDAATGARTTLLGGDREVAECSMDAAGDRLAVVVSDATHPDEVYALDVASGATKKLSGINDAYVASRALAQPERHTAKNSRGESVEYWVLRPPSAIAGKRYPTLVDIHGGPNAEFGETFFHEFQYWAARGYNVVYANPRGSMGYGYAWARELEGNWGDPMFDDVQAVADAAAARDDVDPKRMAVVGGSYGGYATLWVIGHTQRFKAAVAERVVSNMFTQFLGFDFGGSDPGAYAWGDAWSHRDVYWKQSPVAYVSAVHTPLLILHSDRDTRTPVDQTYEEFDALKMLDRPVSLVEVPRDNHDLSRTGEPIHRVERLRLIGDWLSTHL